MEDGKKTMFEILRFAIIVAVAYLLCYQLPPLPYEPAPNATVETMVVFAFLIGFFIDRALARKQTIQRAVLVELSSLRRIHHLCENVSNRAWAKKIEKALAAYHSSLSKNFLAHRETKKRFREISHLIYKYKPKGTTDTLILTDLLSTSRDIALERQQLEQALSNGLSWQSWAVMLTNAISAGFLILLNRSEPGFTQLSATFLMTSVLLVLDLLRQTDGLSVSEVARYQNAYKTNV